MTRSMMRLNMMLCAAIALAHGRDVAAQGRRPDNSARQQSDAQAQTSGTFATYEDLGWELSATEEGVLVERILTGSPAAEAGIDEGDLIIRIGGENVLTPGRTVELLHEHQPQSRVQITVLRDGEELSYLFPLAGIQPGAFAASSSRMGASDQNLIQMIERLQQQCEQQEQLLITLLDEVQELRARLDGAAVAPTTTGGAFPTTPAQTGNTYTGDIVAPLSGGGQAQQPAAGTQPGGSSAPPPRR